MPLLGKSPVPNKISKNNVFFTDKRAHAVKIALLKNRLH